ncbi:hypothetical protein [Vibrio vulnificus]|uniref:hypothetical protein n=1 Tax=Vibrio vulnificus TaxID=672 RepID=UPI001F04066F|nr:hypothetical protein [Vibrio vulnificus]MCG9651463.1 hypothetical protein [Vibrio vulnificus]
MPELYKIESCDEEAARKIGCCILGNGGRCVVAGNAVITDHSFSESDVDALFPLIARTSDNVTMWDCQTFNNR